MYNFSPPKLKHYGGLKSALADSALSQTHASSTATQPQFPQSGHFKNLMEEMEGFESGSNAVNDSEAENGLDAENNFDTEMYNMGYTVEPAYVNLDMHNRLGQYQVHPPQYPNVPPPRGHMKYAAHLYLTCQGSNSAMQYPYSP
ncbi:hypothetical protein C0995_007607 [Termitomyces sp. Mi166|nr:hypothetical protein C0995_007607 [Termitomyces sp. Mi166\